jgi:hypothetical protein
LDGLVPGTPKVGSTKAKRKFETPSMSRVKAEPASSPPEFKTPYKPGEQNGTPYVIILVLENMRLTSTALLFMIGKTLARQLKYSTGILQLQKHLLPHTLKLGSSLLLTLTRKSSLTSPWQ